MAHPEVVGCNGNAAQSIQHGPRMLRTWRILIIIVRVLFAPWNLGIFSGELSKDAILNFTSIQFQLHKVAITLGDFCPQIFDQRFRINLHHLGVTIECADRDGEALVADNPATCTEMPPIPSV